MTTFRQLLDQFEESAKTRSAKGHAFERFCEAFFKVDPYWSDRFDEVWQWVDWPGRGTRPDTGIDLVARERGTDRLVAIQFSRNALAKQPNPSQAETEPHNYTLGERPAH